MDCFARPFLARNLPFFSFFIIFSRRYCFSDLGFRVFESSESLNQSYDTILTVWSCLATRTSRINRYIPSVSCPSYGIKSTALPASTSFLYASTVVIRWVTLPWTFVEYCPPLALTHWGILLLLLPKFPAEQAWIFANVLPILVFVLPVWVFALSGQCAAG